MSKNSNVVEMPEISAMAANVDDSVVSMAEFTWSKDDEYSSSISRPEVPLPSIADGEDSDPQEIPQGVEINGAPPADVLPPVEAVQQVVDNLPPEPNGCCVIV